MEKVAVLLEPVFWSHWVEPSLAQLRPHLKCFPKNNKCQLSVDWRIFSYFLLTPVKELHYYVIR